MKSLPAFFSSSKRCKRNGSAPGPSCAPPSLYRISKETFHPPWTIWTPTGQLPPQASSPLFTRPRVRNVMRTRSTKPLAHHGKQDNPHHPDTKIHPDSEESQDNLHTNSPQHPAEFTELCVPQPTRAVHLQGKAVEHTHRSFHPCQPSTCYHQSSPREFPTSPGRI